MIQILLDHLLRHLPYRGAEVPPGPEVPTPIPLSQARILFQQLARRPPLDPPHDLDRRHGRRATCQNVHVILAHYSLHYSNLKRLTRLTNQPSYSLRNLSRQHLLTEFRHPHKVVLDLKYRMAAISVLHAAPPLAQPIFAAKADRLKPVVLTL